MFLDRVSQFFSLRGATSTGPRVEKYVARRLKTQNASYVRGLNDVDHADLDKNKCFPQKKVQQKRGVFEPSLESGIT